MALRNTVEADKEKLLFQLFFLKNDDNLSVEVVEVKEIDFTAVKKHIGRGESVFITPKSSQEFNRTLVAEDVQNPSTLLARGEADVSTHLLIELVRKERKT